MVTAVAAVIPESAHAATVGILLKFGWLNGGDISRKRRNPRATCECRDEHEGKSATKRHGIIEVGRTSRIRRRRAQDVADTTDAIRAVACIRFVRLGWWLVLSSGWWSVEDLSAVVSVKLADNLRQPRLVRIGGLQ